MPMLIIYAQARPDAVQMQATQYMRNKLSDLLQGDALDKWSVCLSLSPQRPSILSWRCHMKCAKEIGDQNAKGIRV